VSSAQRQKGPPTCPLGGGPLLHRAALVFLLLGPFLFLIRRLLPLGGLLEGGREATHRHEAGRQTGSTDRLREAHP